MMVDWVPSGPTRYTGCNIYFYNKHPLILLGYVLSIECDFQRSDKLQCNGNNVHNLKENKIIMIKFIRNKGFSMFII